MREEYLTSTGSLQLEYKEPRLHILKQGLEQNEKEKEKQQREKEAKEGGEEETRWVWTLTRSH